MRVYVWLHLNGCSMESPLPHPCPCNRAKRLPKWVAGYPHTHTRVSKHRPPPSLQPDYKRGDSFSTHTGCPVIKGVKWNAVKWIHGIPFRGEGEGTWAKTIGAVEALSVQPKPN